MIDEKLIKNGTPKRRPFGEEEGGLALRSRLDFSLAWLCRIGHGQLANRSGDFLPVLLAVLNRHASSGSQFTVALGLRIQRELFLLGLATNFLRNDESVRVDRSDRALGEMRRRLGYFRLGS